MSATAQPLSESADRDASVPESGGYWRSLDQLENNAEFRRFLEREFPENAGSFPEGVTRRRWLQLMGASLALAGVGGLTGCRWPHQKFTPETVRMRTRIPGNTVKFATSFVLSGVGYPLLATSSDGRPIKMDGNPDTPEGSAGSSALLQASLLGLYDPDRLYWPVKRGGEGAAPNKLETFPSKHFKTLQGDQANGLALSSWSEFEAFAGAHFKALRESGGKGLAFLAAPNDGPSMAAMRLLTKAAYPQALWCTYEPLARDGERELTQQVYGKPARALVDLTRVDIVVDIEADFLHDHPQALALSKAFAERRVPENGPMNRLYVIESQYTSTGVAADHRLATRVSDLVALLKDLEAAIKAKQEGKAEPAAAEPKPVDADGKPAEAKAAEGADKHPDETKPAAAKGDRRQAFLAALADDLASHRSRSVLIAGGRLPLAVQIMVYRINQMLGNVGQSIRYVAEPADGWHEQGAPTALAAAKALVEKMQAGSVSTLVILGGNPAYDFPADLDFAGALTKVATTIRLGHALDETGRQCLWQLPAGHDYESWGDTRSWAGTLNIQQPLINWDSTAEGSAPLVDSRSELELLSLLAEEKPLRGYDIVRRTAQSLLKAPSFEKAWERFVHDGYLTGDSAKLVDLGSAQTPDAPATPAAVEGLEVVLAASRSVYDGRFANNAWLQELPDAVTKTTWGNVALLAPATAKEKGVWTGDEIELTVGDKKVLLPVYVMPGQAVNSVTVALGYGRESAGSVGGFYYVKYGFDLNKLNIAYSEETPPVGVNVYPMRTTASPYVVAGATVSKTGKTVELPTTQNHHGIDAIGEEGIKTRLPALVREGTEERYTKHPDFAQHVVHHPPIVSPWQEPDVSGKEQAEQNQYAWGMAIDLSKCTGCNACIVACQSENNVPVVGKEQVIVGREMHWLRVDRYFAGDADNPTVVTAPVTCQHCENAPCEQVCPVAATVHSTEGLNTMAYNRCIGTRYCANNCPYKVRRFNYFDYQRQVHGSIWKRAADSLRMLSMNPEVTVRSRGVMEKCTYCVQRIQEAKIHAKNERRSVRDGEIVTACGQACPAGAIVFGDVNPPRKGTKATKVRQWHDSPRAYAMLEELNVKPRTKYLARIRNPHPSLDEPYIHLVPEAHHGGGHHGKGDGHGHDHEHPHDHGHEHGDQKAEGEKHSRAGQPLLYSIG